MVGPREAGVRPARGERPTGAGDYAVAMEPGMPRRRLRAMDLTSPRLGRRLAAAVVAVALGAAACTASGGSASPPAAGSSASSSPSPAPAATGGATLNPAAGAAAAFDAVRARSPWFDGIGPKSATAIGQASWWEATAGGGGSWRVAITVGWGDCPSGCVSRHVWRWAVGADGSVAFAGETGPAVPAGDLAALASAATSSGVGGQVGAGPTCPVVRPGQSGCDDRPVAGAVLVVRGAVGQELARFTTDASGLYRIALPAGAYTLAAQSVAGLLGTPAPISFHVAAGVLTVLPVTYDTGIR